METFEKIENMSVEKLCARAKKIEKAAAVLRRKIESHITRTSALQEKRAVLEEDMRTLEQQQEKIKSCIVARTPLSDAVSSARKEYLAAVEQGVSTDNTKKRDILSSVAGNLLQKLQEVCDHRFILKWTGYGGSRVVDGEDAYPGCRVCLVCGSWETSKNCIDDLYSDDNFYSVLTQSEARLIRGTLLDKYYFANHAADLLPIATISAAFIRVWGQWDVVEFPEGKEKP